MDETSRKVKGEWKYLYRAVDKYGKTIEFLLTEQRDAHGAKTLLTQAIRRQGGVPEKIPIDGSAAHEAASQSSHEAHGTAIIIRQSKYLNNIVEIVCTHWTKTRYLATRMGGDGIADCPVPMRDQDAIKQEYPQGALWCKRRVR